MDLGFGNANQVVGAATANAILQTAKVQETLIDNAVDQYDALLEDDDALDLLRERRLKQLQQNQQQRNKWKDQGHGEYSELAESDCDVAKAFFNATKQSERMVVHFHRPTTLLCNVFHKHLTDIAAQHLETKFIKINVESAERDGNQGIIYLVDKLGITCMPTVVLVLNRKVVYQLRGCSDLGESEDFPPTLLKQVMAAHGVLNLSDFEMDQMDDRSIP